MAPAMRLAGLLFLLAAAAPIASAQGPWINGDASHTLGPEGNDLSLGFPASLPNGFCGYGEITEATFPGYLLTGIGKSSVFKKNGQSGCGTCVEVKCADKEYCNSPTKTITVMVYDACDECGVNQLNLNAKAFNQLAPLDLGRMPIMYREVPCSFKNGITVNIDTYRTSAGGWLRLSLTNVAGDVASVQLGHAKENMWRSMTNAHGAQWEISKLPGSPPYDVKVTNSKGQSVVLSSAITKAGVTGEVKTTSQFKA